MVEASLAQRRQVRLAHFCGSLGSRIWRLHTRGRWWHEGPPLARSAPDIVLSHWDRETRNDYLKLANGPYKAARDAYVAPTASCTKSLYQ